MYGHVLLVPKGTAKRCIVQKL